MGVASSPDVTCWFSACYKLTQRATSYYFVPPVSCVVQSHYSQPDASHILIKPTTTSDAQPFSTIWATGLQVTYDTPSYQMQPSQQMKYTSLDSSTLITASNLPVPHAPASQMHEVELVPSSTKDSPSSQTQATVSLALAPYADALQLSLDEGSPLYTPCALKTHCYSFFHCNPGYVAISLVVMISLALIQLAVAIILILRQRMISIRYVVGPVQV